MTKNPNRETEKLRNALDQVRSLLPKLEAANEKIAKSGKEAESLLNFADSLYEEIDKLSKKAPTEPLTDLALQQVNDAVREAKVLGAEDSTLRRVKEFVPAGDNPQHRDVVLVLRLVRAGLAEVQKRLAQESQECLEQLNDAEALEAAVKSRLDDGPTDAEFFNYYGLSPSEFWQTESTSSEYEFNFDRLEEVHLASHFTS